MKKTLLVLPILCLGLGMLPAPGTCPTPGTAAQGALQDTGREGDGALPIVPTPGDARVTMEPRVEDLAFLSGAWRGSDGSSEWETWYSSPAGGRIVSASKELRDGRAVMFDFETIDAGEDGLRLTPFPFGKQSVSFALTSYSAADRRAVFENPQHDFPRRFTYERVADDRLEILLEGELQGEALRVHLRLQRPD
ncbi:MAG: DUF6265 family protein [Planctomycetota bacterium]|jgi:hypothetical protein